MEATQWTTLWTTLSHRRRRNRSVYCCVNNEIYKYSPSLSQVDENYDPTEFFSGIGGGVDHNGQPNGDGDRLQDDLAVSDDSEDEKEKEDDPMAF